MSSTYVKRVGHMTWKTNIGAKKIDDSIFKTFEIVIADFKVENKIGRLKFL